MQNTRPCPRRRSFGDMNGTPSGVRDPLLGHLHQLCVHGLLPLLVAMLSGGDSSRPQGEARGQTPCKGGHPGCDHCQETAVQSVQHLMLPRNHFQQAAPGRSTNRRSVPAVGILPRQSRSEQRPSRFPLRLLLISILCFSGRWGYRLANTFTEKQLNETHVSKNEIVYETMIINNMAI